MFKAELSTEEITILNGIATNHSGEPLSDNSIMEVDVITENKSSIQRGNYTQGFFRAESLILNIPADVSVSSHLFSWPISISLKSATINIATEMKGDSMEVHVAPNTLIGALIQSLSTGDTSLYVSPTVLDYIKPGYSIGIYGSDSDTGSEISQVISIDKINSKLILENPSPVSAAPGTYVAMCVKIIPKVYFYSTNVVEIGKNIPTSQFIAAGTKINVIYTNTDLTAKKLSVFVEYFY